LFAVFEQMFDDRNCEHSSRPRHAGRFDIAGKVCPQLTTGNTAGTYQRSYTMKNATITTAPALAEVMRESYRRSRGESVTVTLPGATITAPAFLTLDDRVVNVGAVILEAVAFHVSEWGQSERGAMAELAQRWQDMVSHPSAPAVELVAIDWALDLDALVNPAG